MREFEQTNKNSLKYQEWLLNYLENISMFRDSYTDLDLMETAHELIK